MTGAHDEPVHPDPVTNDPYSAEERAYVVAVGRRLRQLRLARDWTQSYLAERAGMNRAYLGMVERGLRAAGLVVLVRLADALQVEPGELLPPQARDTVRPGHGAPDASRPLARRRGLAGPEQLRREPVEHFDSFHAAAMSSRGSAVDHGESIARAHALVDMLGGQPSHTEDRTVEVLRAYAAAVAWAHAVGGSGQTPDVVLARLKSAATRLSAGDDSRDPVRVLIEVASTALTEHEAGADG